MSLYVTDMAQQTTAADETADTEDDETEYEVTPNLNIQPTVRLKATLKDLSYGGRLGSDYEQNDTTSILELTDIDVIEGTVFENDIKEADGTTADAIDDDDPRPTDYRIVDVDDQSANAKGDFLFTNEQFGDYTEVDEISENGVISLWLNGMSGQRSMRSLDFNGSPFASYTDQGSIVKGLLQVADGWRDASSKQKKEMVQDDKAPRVTRPTILREDCVDRELVIDMGRLNSGRGYELNIFYADQMEEDIGVDGDIDELRNDMGWVEADYLVTPQFTDFDEADEIINENGISFSFFHGEGWEDEPENAETTAADFDVSVGGGDDSNEETVDEDGFTDSQLTFIEAVANAMKGTGSTPNEFYSEEGGLMAIIEKNTDQFDVTPDVEEVREELYSRLQYLDVADMD